jgi:hypothetical protein
MYYYIVNPAAGNNQLDDIEDKLKDTFAKLHIEGQFVKTIGAGDAGNIAQKAIGGKVKTLVAIGGDDTVNEIINAVYVSGNKDVAIGIIPTGKQNVLASRMGIGDWRSAAQALASRRLQEFSLLTANGQVFLYSFNIVPAEQAEAASFDYLVEVNRGYKLRGKAAEMVVYNQKFFHPELDNRLMLQLYDSPLAKGSRSGFLGNWLGKLRQPVSASTTNHPFSQFYAQELMAQAKSPAIASIDGHHINGQNFELGLTTWQLRIITGRYSPDG